MQYDVNVTRDGKWWMIEVPAIDGLTQARRVSEVEDQARSLIATMLDVPLSKVELGRVSLDIPGAGDVSAAVAEMSHQKAIAAEAEEMAAKMMRDAAWALVGAEVPLRDVGSILGVSHQRVAQILSD